MTPICRTTFAGACMLFVTVQMAVGDGLRMYAPPSQLRASGDAMVAGETPVSLEPALADALALSDDVRVSFPLPDATVVTASLESFAVRSPTSRTLIGAPDDDPSGWMTVTVHDGVVFANIQSRVHGDWHLRTANDGSAVLRRIDASAMPCCGVDHTDDQPMPLSSRAVVSPSVPSGLRGAAACDDGSEVDILVVYSSLGTASVGGETAMQALINMAIDETNLAFVNSMIPASVRLAHTQEVAYTDATGVSTDLTRLREKNDGFLDEVHDLRDQHNADLVCFLSTNVSVCGIANFGVLQGLTPREDLGFSVVRVSCATGPGYVFAHEIGHNLGGQHDWSEPCFNGSTPYAKAHTVEGAFQTVVGSAGETTIPYYSNPDVSFMGDPTGVPLGDLQPSNNAEAITLAAPIVARFRSADCDADGQCDADQILADPSLDCNGNGELDACEPDWNRNGIPDDCDVADGTSMDLDGDGVPDEAEVSRLYVDQTAPAGQIGLDWSGAYNELRDAIAFAEVSGDVDEIWVAAGTYKPAPNTWRAESFNVPAGVSLYGGFAGEEATIDARDIGGNTTVLSGDLLGDDGPNVTNRDDNSVHVVQVRSGGSVVIDGFTITGGHAEQPTNCSLDSRGGGLLALFTEVTIRNCRFEGNAAEGGGGLFTADGSVPVVINCDFVGNNAIGSPSAATGAGAYFFNAPSEANAARVLNCRFLGNTSDGGSAGVFTRNWSPTFTNCEFIGNRNLGIYGRGAGLRTSFTVLPVFTNCVFANNIAEGIIEGGGLYIFRSDAILSNCIVWGNDTINRNDGQREQVTFFRPTGSSDPVTVSNTIIQDWDGTLPDVVATNTFDADPLFVDIDGADDVLGTDDDDARLSAGSPAIDAGDNTLLPADTYDIDGDADVLEVVPIDLQTSDRFVDDPATVDTGMAGSGRSEVVDIGAHEFVPAGCPCELNGDSVVGIGDLLAFLGLWFAENGTSVPMGAGADYDASGTVDIGDLLAFLACWFDASGGACA